MRYLAIPYQLEHYKNIDMRDVRNVADFFSSIDRGCSDETVHMEACDILCHADAASLRTRKLMARTIQANNGAYTQQGSGIMNLLGLPLQAASFNIFPGPIEPRGNAIGHRNPEVAELCRDINSSIKGRSAQVAEEDAARDLMVATYGPMAAMIGGGRNVDVGKMGFGSVHARWEKADVGSVCVARADGKPLLAEHLEALCAFGEEKVAPALTKAVANVGVGELVPGRDAVLNQITKSKFLEFFADFKIRQAAETGMNSWLTCSSPWG